MLVGFIDLYDSQGLVEGQWRGMVKDIEQPGHMRRIDQSDKFFITPMRTQLIMIGYKEQPQPLTTCFALTNRHFNHLNIDQMSKALGKQEKKLHS